MKKEKSSLHPWKQKAAPVGDYTVAAAASKAFPTARALKKKKEKRGQQLKSPFSLPPSFLHSWRNRWGRRRCYSALRRSGSWRCPARKRWEDRSSVAGSPRRGDCAWRSWRLAGRRWLRAWRRCSRESAGCASPGRRTGTRPAPGCPDASRRLRVGKNMCMRWFGFFF